MTTENLETLKMKAVEQVLRKWDQGDRKKRAVICPVCGKKPATLVIRENGAEVIGVCSQCFSCGKIVSSRVTDKKREAMEQYRQIQQELHRLRYEQKLLELEIQLQYKKLEQISL
ncbi:MAG: hypothetical protein ACOX60_11860 [Massiliimalia sp.]|jgi:ribosome-binding protein aMBF1 (putative translation factor)